MEKKRAYTFTSFFNRSLDEVWSAISDTNRLNETEKSWGPYTAENIEEPDGSVSRHARGKMGPLNVEWHERFGEWIDKRYMRQIRTFTKGPLRSFSSEIRLTEDQDGVRVTYEFIGTWDSVLGSFLVRTGLLKKSAESVVKGFENSVSTLVAPQTVPLMQARPDLKAGGREKLNICIGKLVDAGLESGLVSKLANQLCTALAIDLKKIRPKVLARDWGVPPHGVIELMVAAQHAGLVTMRWEILCPRCRGAEAPVENLYELPRGTHCNSCNIDYERDFSRNVELVFGAPAWLREMPEGEFCMMGPASTPHVKLQLEVEPGAQVSEQLDLAPGRYILRTVESGGQAEFDYEGGPFPQIIVQDDQTTIGAATFAGTVTLCNQGRLPRNIVIEEQAWVSDALTGAQVISMNAFRKLCPEQLLRPGDDVEIGQVSIMFTDLKGSTALYAEIGDSAAYGLVRDHFTFLADKIRENHGILVKTIGDSVMAAFEEPGNAVRAAQAIQRDVTSFNTDRNIAQIILKIGIHQGACIAVTTGGILDYFGTTVNIAARLEEESRGDDIVLSAEMADDITVASLLKSFQLKQDSAILHGFKQPRTFFRLSHPT